jgi:hypothetical protein
MQLDALPQYFFQYKYATRAVADGRNLPVSTAFTEAGNHWVTLPWDTIVTAPADTSGVYNPEIDPGETFWSFLYGPCVFSITAAVGLGQAQPLASVHFQPWAAANGSEVMTQSWEGWELGVLEKEGNTCHFTGAWWGHLAAGNKLRLRLDYWHADQPAKINRAHVEGSYWRLPAA